MKHVTLILLVALTTGCATTSTTSRPEVVNGMPLKEQLQAYIDEYYDQTVDVCIAIHGSAQMGKSRVDCAVAGNTMFLNFPNIPFHNRDDIYRKAQELEYNWCASAQSKTGKTAKWVRFFRAEQERLERACYQGDKLRTLQSSLKAH